MQGATAIDQQISTESTSTSLTVRRPLHSRVAPGRSQPKRTHPLHIPSQDEMWSRMRSRDALRICLETEEITPKRFHDEIDICFCERRVELQRAVQSYPGRGADGWVEEGLEGEIPADVVWDGVGDPDVFEAGSGDLEVVVRVAPGSQTVVRGV